MNFQLLLALLLRECQIIKDFLIYQ